MRYSESRDQSTWNNAASGQFTAPVPKVSQESPSYKMHSPNTQIELQRSEKSGFLLTGNNQKNDGEYVCVICAGRLQVTCLAHPKKGEVDL